MGELMHRKLEACKKHTMFVYVKWSTVRTPRRSSQVNVLIVNHQTVELSQTLSLKKSVLFCQLGSIENEAVTDAGICKLKESIMEDV